MSLTPLATAPISVCIVIPCFNHGPMMPAVITRLRPFGLQCIIVDDGSEPGTREMLRALAGPRITLVRHAINQGKGQAVLTGLAAAAEAGFTHALQVDADGQHCLEDIPLMIAAAAAQPNTLISGQPIYDQSVPRARLYGRYITHFWVWIETLSLSLKDSMCGFRVYPVPATLALARAVALGKRMDFDTEVMVRLYWQGTESRFIPTRVTYPAEGLSHFDGLRDNARISLMHARLFLGMLPRLPGLLARNWRRRSRKDHWSRTEERHGALGMRVMLTAYRIGGRTLFNALLYPVIGYFWLTGRTARQASVNYLSRITVTAERKGVSLPHPLNSFRHFMRFGNAMLDKLAGWRGDLRLGDQVVFADDRQKEHIEQQRGLLVLASHLGDIEVCRALAQGSGNIKINALVFSAHAKRFKALLTEVCPDAGINLIAVDDIGPDTAILLKTKLDAGEWVAIVGDRTPVIAPGTVNPSPRVIWSEFLGEPAPFPQGPFILAAALCCPVALIFALKQHNRLQIHFEHFADRIALPRSQRQLMLQQTVDRYAARLEHYCMISPLDWFNFFDFWQLPEASSPAKEDV